MDQRRAGDPGYVSKQPATRDRMLKIEIPILSDPTPSTDTECGPAQFLFELTPGHVDRSKITMSSNDRESYQDKIVDSDSPLRCGVQTPEPCPSWLAMQNQ